MSKQKPCTNCIHFTRIVDATFMQPIRKPFCRKTKTDITEDQWNNGCDCFEAKQQKPKTASVETILKIKRKLEAKQ